jgi:hypothetical protein
MFHFRFQQENGIFPFPKSCFMAQHENAPNPGGRKSASVAETNSGTSFVTTITGNG